MSPYMVTAYWGELAFGLLVSVLALTASRRLARSVSPARRRQGRFLPLFLVPFLLWGVHAGCHLWAWPHGGGVIRLLDQALSHVSALYLAGLAVFLNCRAR